MLDEQPWRSLAALGRQRWQFRKGDTLVREGASGRDVFVITCGIVRIVNNLGIATVGRALRGPGDIVGERAILREGRRNASAVALTEGHASRIPESMVEEYFRANPSDREKILVASLDRQHTESLRLHQVYRPYVRLARFLVDWEELTNDQTIRDLSRAMIGQHTGMDRTTVRPNLDWLRDRGAISLNGRLIRLENLDTLREIAKPVRM